jgi:hypothetical protein
MSVRDAKIARIFYRTDAGRTDAEEFALGVLVFVEAVHIPGGKDATVMMLMAREKLDSEWEAKMNPVARHLLEKPADFFQAEIEQALAANASGDVLTALATKFSWSISISPPIEVNLPSNIVEMFDKIVREKAPPQLSGPARMVPLSKRPGIREVPPDSELLRQIAGPALQGAVNFYDMPPAWMIASQVAAASTL